MSTLNILLNYMKKFTDKDTEAYFDSFGNMYAIMGSQQIHTGYFGSKKIKTLEQASVDMNIFLANQAKFKKGKKLLSIGCGRGETEIFLAKKYKLNITGVDLSENQLKQALEKTKEEGLLGKINYVKASMTKIPINDNFDYLLAQESFLSCHEPEKAIKEFARLLKKGAIVVLEEKIVINSNFKSQVMDAYGKRIRLNNLCTQAELEEMFHGSEFKTKKVIDLSEDLIKTYDVIIKHLENNRGSIKKKIPKHYWEALERNFDLENTKKLVEEKKLGCIALFLEKI